MVRQKLADIGQRQRGLSREQRKAKLCLQIRQIFAQILMRDEQAVGGSCQIAFLRQYDEIVVIVEHKIIVS